MSEFKHRFVRAVRANLNHLLDQVKDFEDDGGFGQFFDGTTKEQTSGQRQRRPVSNMPQQKSIRDYYANLEVPFGSDLQTVKASYHRLMRQYHPDRHANDPEREAMATELAQELARAYQAIESYLTTGKY